MQVPLSAPIIIAGRKVVAIDLRPPGRRVLDAMSLARGPVGFTEAAAARFAARLSEHTEPTIHRLCAADLATLAQSLDELYRAARKRFVVRTALAEASRIADRAQREADKE